MPARSPEFQHLVIVHYHLRPGGVRRLIEIAAPAIVRRGGFLSLAVISGGPAHSNWAKAFAQLLPEVRVRFLADAAFDYSSPQRCAPRAMRMRIRRVLEKAADLPERTLVWAHNLGLGRNLFLADELRRFCGEKGMTLISHHHDFWFENRWSRWPEFRAAGFGRLDRVARAVFSCGARTAHLAINRPDCEALSEDLFVRWMPNPAAFHPPVSQSEIRSARAWLHERLGEAAPVWIAPARILRRKNLAEAILLTRWLRPEAWFVTAGGPSSTEESAYARRLASAVRRGRWRVRFQILSDAAAVPAMPSVLAACEVVLLTSAQEGFGLAYLEAAAAGKPLVARQLANVVPDLRSLGLRLPQAYRDVLVPPDLFDVGRERHRQHLLWRRWKASLPGSCRHHAGRPLFLELPAGRPVPFSRLTLDAQLEILSIAPEESWKACQGANPSLRRWRRHVREGGLHVASWQPQAFAPERYAQDFLQVAAAIPDAPPLSPRAAASVQRRLVARRLDSEFLYPLLLSDCSSTFPRTVENSSHREH